MNEIQKLFYLKQKQLIDFANSNLGRKYLELQNFPNKIVQVGINHVTTHLGRNRFKGKFWVGTDKVARILGLALTSQEIIGDNTLSSFLHYLNIQRKPHVYPQILFTDYYTSAGDGQVRTGGKATWTLARDAASGDVADYVSSPTLARALLAGADYACARMFFPADTSGISGGTVTEAIFNYYVAATANYDTTTADLVETSQASTSELVVNDFNNLVFTGIGSRNIADLTTSANNTWTVTDLSKISTSGFTKIGMIIGRDLNNQAPTGDDNYVYGNMSESETNKPYYAITFTGIGGAKLQHLTLLGVG